MKDRSGASVADKLQGRCLKLRSTPEGMHYYSHRIQLQSDQESEFINRDVLNWSKEVGAMQSFSCPGDLGKWQNSTCQRKIKDLGAIMRSIMHRSEAPQAPAEYAMYHAEDIMDAVPTSANITLDECAGLSPNEGRSLHQPVPGTPRWRTRTRSLGLYSSKTAHSSQYHASSMELLSLTITRPLSSLQPSDMGIASSGVHPPSDGATTASSSFAQYESCRLVGGQPFTSNCSH
jgi:hypothetical protein